jgi:hypothetical protein
MKLADVLEGVCVQEPRSWGNVQVFPLIQPNGHEPGYALVDELLALGAVGITELDEAGVVPTIKVRNDADIDALILDGSELRGAKQNRMVNITVIVGKHTEVPIPVSCVERGRWAYRSRGFSSQGRTVASKLRNAKAYMVHDSLAAGGQGATDQMGVWSRVDGYFKRSGAHSKSAALDDVFAECDTDVEAVVEALGQTDACGAVVAINGEIVALDLLDHRDTFAKLWTGLLRGYAIDAVLDRPKEVRVLTRHDVEQWVQAVAQRATTTQHEVSGVGEYYAIRSPKVAGSVVLHKGQAVHTVLFPAAR